MKKKYNELFISVRLITDTDVIRTSLGNVTLDPNELPILPLT